jgi:hypothetical protein
MKFMANTEPDGIIAIRIRDNIVSDSAPTYLAEPVAFNFVPYVNDTCYTAPAFRLRTEEAQGLLDALWNQGLRPSNLPTPPKAELSTEMPADYIGEIIRSHTAPLQAQLRFAEEVVGRLLTILEKQR